MRPPDDTRPAPARQPSRPLFVTTPIYYVNSAPTVGTAYTTIAADVFARYARLRGRPTRYLTGLDEHGLKIGRRAAEEGLAPQAYVDRMEPEYRAAWAALGITYDDFIRTTEPRHVAHVQELWRRVEKNGDIYLGAYEDWYCVGCEGYYTEKELLPGNLCPVHKTAIEKIKEESYFFRLSKYTQPLLDHYEKHPQFVRPEGKFNEVKAFVKEGLRDLSVSRTSFRWGVPVPNDPEHVMYVWFDALGNYVTALGAPELPGEEAPLREQFWPERGEAVHILGKDILRFHCVYWPAFLLSAGLPLPTSLHVHGFLTINGEKISKSMGNAIAPIPLAEALGADVLRYYLMRDFAFGQDGDFVHKNLLGRYHGDLGNGLGNLLNRIVASIVAKSFDGKVPHVHADALTDADREVIATAARAAEATGAHLDAMAPNRALEAAWELVLATNKYVDTQAPWNLAKSGDTARLAVVSYTVLEALRFLSVMLWPVLPEKCDGLRAQLGLGPLRPIEGEDRWPSAWGGLVGGTATRPAAPLFPRLDDAQQGAVLERLGVRAPGPVLPATPTKKEATVEAAPAEASKFGSIDELAKLGLKLGLVLAAERVPKSDKLLKLSVDVGEAAPRQILAGIGKVYAPEDLVGKRLVVVANLAPRKMMGLESQGMVLAAGSGERETISVLGVDKELPPGSDVR